jgi:exopolysaccharide biosynthesis protein
MRKPLPAVWVVVLDILLSAACLLSFCYFHHVRKLWGSSEEGEDPISIITKPLTTTKETVSTSLPTTNEEPKDDGVDYSGDFGAKFGALFSSDDSVYQDDTQYRSHDIYLTVHSCDTTIAQITSKGDSESKNTHVVYSYLDVYVRNIENLYTVYNTKERVPFSTLYEDSTLGQTIAAISGDLFYGYENYKLVIVRNGNVIRYSSYITSDILVLYWDGTMETISKSQYDWDEIVKKSPYQIWNFGPELLDEDGNVKTNTDSSIWGLHPRTAIGMVEPGHYILLSVSGYRDSSEKEANGVGMTLETLANLMKNLGCTVAYNLDGGASSYCAYWDQMLVVVSNSNGSKRTISDIICIGEVTS